MFIIHDCSCTFQLLPWKSVTVYRAASEVSLLTTVLFQYIIISLSDGKNFVNHASLRKFNIQLRQNLDSSTKKKNYLIFWILTVGLCLLKFQVLPHTNLTCQDKNKQVIWALGKQVYFPASCFNLWLLGP